MIKYGAVFLRKKWCLSSKYIIKIIKNKELQDRLGERRGGEQKLRSDYKNPKENKLL